MEDQRRPLEGSISALPGGLVNQTGIMRSADGEPLYVYQRSQSIPLGYVDTIYADRDACEEVGLRQVQVDPAKFLRAEKISHTLVENAIKHSDILHAEDNHTYGAATLTYIDGVAGSERLASNEPQVWAAVGSFVGRIHGLAYEQIATSLRHDLDTLHNDDWLDKRFLFLVERMKTHGQQVDTSLAIQAYQKLFSILPAIEQPICLTYDDPKPDSLLFPHRQAEDPHIVDMESFTIGHRIVDGIGRALYWGPARESLKKGAPVHSNAADTIAQSYNEAVPPAWRLSDDEIDLWCIASELFWLPDVIATHSLAPFLPAAQLQGVAGKVRRFTHLTEALSSGNITLAREITLTWP